MEAYRHLEKTFGEWIGNPNTVACSSGTAALHLALETLDSVDMSIAVPEFTMIACARAVTLSGAIPIFVDCTDDLLMNVDKIPHNHVGAIMPVHIYGRRCDMEKLVRNHTSRSVIIEDMAEAHGLLPHPASDVACWSFYKNKIVAGEEGGMAAFKNPDHADRARRLRTLGFTESHDFQHTPRGMNYRMSNAHAKLIQPSLDWADLNLQDRRQIETWYDALIPKEWKMPTRDVVWVYDLRIPDMDYATQNYVVSELNRQDIAARHGFKPMSSQLEYKRRYDHLNAYRLSREVIYLPVDTAMTKADVEKNVAALIHVVG